jgi:hypothetical protein
VGAFNPVSIGTRTSKKGEAYFTIDGLYGPEGVLEKLKVMGLEKNEFMKWMKEAAKITARRATHLAPRDTGNLATNIGGYAGKKITPNNAPSRFIFGSMVIAQPKIKMDQVNAAGELTGRRVNRTITFKNFQGKSITDNVTYGKSISLGRYYPLTGKRTKGNPYIRNARDQTRSAVVKMWNTEIGRWIEKNGFETTGFGS